MSFIEGKSGALSISSQVKREGRRITVKTHWLWRLLSLFSFARVAVIDITQKRIEIDVRRFWLFNSHAEIAFNEIEYIDYAYSGLATGINMFGDSTDGIDSFRVVLVLPDGQRFPIAAFRGEGSRMNGAVMAITGFDSAVDLAGDQDEQSLDFVELLAKLTGARIGQPILSNKKIYACEGCGRAGSPQKKCIYCGRQVSSM